MSWDAKIIYIQNVVDHDYIELVLKVFLKESNLDVSKALVKTSSGWFSVLMYSRDIILLLIKSQMKLFK